jgi:3',5'-cyclic AMP phosphodiesterase CpdA
MGDLSVRRVVGAVVVIAAATAGCTSSSSDPEPGLPGAPPASSPTRPSEIRSTILDLEKLPLRADTTVDYVFAAAPDFINQDVGDVRSEPGWDPGDPNSWSGRLWHATNLFLNEIATARPDSVLVPGDLVEGHWGRDKLDTGIFGPVTTPAEQRRALVRAAELYYGAYADRFASRGLTLHAALGDHDIGDNPWDDSDPDTTAKRRMVPLFKREFARHFTQRPDGSPRYPDRPVGTPYADTAYATRLTPDLLLVSLDEFRRTADDVEFEVVGGQLRWLRGVLADARRDHVRWVVVQGHNPILTPVRTRSSSGGSMAGGPDTALWRTMVHGGVDLYLAGEVHNTTMRQADGITQITTGGLMYTGDATYMLARVYRDRMTFEVHEFDGRQDPEHSELWQTTGYRTRGETRYPDVPSGIAGSMTLTVDGRAVNQVGKLQAYDK